MAAEPVAEIALTAPAAQAKSGRGHLPWRAYHLYYHHDQDFLLAALVKPLLVDLLSRRWIDRFYFVRYGLGGPHIRLRLRWTDDPRGETIEGAARDFFARHPSRHTLTDEEILRRNQQLVRIDPLADPAQDRVFRDNSLVEFLPQFEVERYGGDELFPHSLEFFSYSSAESLLLLAGAESLTPGDRLTLFSRLVVRMAWGFAEEEEELFALAGYAEQFMGDAFAGCAEAADRYFRRSRCELTRLVRDELEGLVARPWRASAENLATVAEAARRLAVEVHSLPTDERWYLTASHIHMTANRLRVLNPEEVYVGRLVWRALRDVAGREPDWWRATWRRRPPRELRRRERLGDMVPPLLDRLIASEGLR